jgi:methylenetetrahydrofolate dehydrogenase (NADP+)/methenyltetrahydrofolate cyclohydrolase
MAQILDGRAVSNSILEEVKSEIDSLPENAPRPKLVIILVGNNPASESYVKSKGKKCAAVGIDYQQLNYGVDVTVEEILAKIGELNEDPSVHGILVQLPLPKHISQLAVIAAIDPRKDVDGFHQMSLGQMFIGGEFEGLVPCTPKGIIKLLEYYKINPSGKNVTVIGNSNIVGKPAAIMMLNRGATVTVCHSKTTDLKSHTINADIIISATGVPGLVTADMVKEGAVVIDVGCTKVGEKLVGDVDYETVEKKASAITPVPGGVGPMTVACVIQNTLLAFKGLNIKV